MLAKLVALKAESFVDAKTKTGLDKPALVVSASYDEGKFERVRFGQVDETRSAPRRRSRRRQGRQGVDASGHDGVRPLVTPPAPAPTNRPKRNDAGSAPLARGDRLALAAVLCCSARRVEDAPAVSGDQRRPSTNPTITNSCGATCAPSSPTRLSITACGRYRCSRSNAAKRSTASTRSRLQVPASNQKLLTTAVAAERLGWDYRYTTRLYGTGPISADGRLEGDLDRGRMAIPRSTRGIRSGGPRSTTGRSSSPRKA